MSHLNQEVAMTIKIEGEAFASWDGLDEQIVRKIADHFISDHQMKLKDRVQAIIAERVTAVVEARVEAFLAKPIPPMTRYGEPVEGAVARSLSDMIADAADAAMTETVDVNGKPERQNAYNKSTTFTRLEWLVKRVAKEGIAMAVEKAVKEVNAEARAAVQKQVAAEIAARLAKA